MRNDSLAALIVIVLSFLPTLARAQRDNCVAALIQDVRSVTLDSASSFALVDLISDKSANDSGKGDSIDVPGIGSASSERVARRLSEFKRQTGIAWDQTTRVSMAAQTLSGNAVEAYRACIDGAHRSGPRAVAYNATPQSVTVKVTWLSPPGAPTESSAKWSVEGGVLPEVKKKWRTGESEVLIVKREKGRSLRIVVTIGDEADDLFIPYNPRVREIVIPGEPEQFPEGRGKRMANDGTGHAQGPISDCVYAGQGEEIDPGSVTVNTTTKVGALNDRSYARKGPVDFQKACYEAFLYPLSKGGGGDMWFHMKYRRLRFQYEIEE